MHSRSAFNPQNPNFYRRADQSRLVPSYNPIQSRAYTEFRKSTIDRKTFQKKPLQLDIGAGDSEDYWSGIIYSKQKPQNQLFLQRHQKFLEDERKRNIFNQQTKCFQKWKRNMLPKIESQFQNRVKRDWNEENTEYLKIKRLRSNQNPKTFLNREMSVPVGHFKGFKKVKVSPNSNFSDERVNQIAKPNFNRYKVRKESRTNFPIEWKGLIANTPDFKIELKIEAKNHRILNNLQSYYQNQSRFYSAECLSNFNLSKNTENEFQSNTSTASAQQRSSSKNNFSENNLHRGQNIYIQKQIQNNNVNLKILKPVYQIQSQVNIPYIPKSHFGRHEFDFFNIFNNCKALNPKNKNQENFRVTIRKAVDKKLKLSPVNPSIQKGLDLNLAIFGRVSQNDIPNVQKMKIICFFFNKLVKKETVLTSFDNMDNFKDYFFCEGKKDFKNLR